MDGCDLEVTTAEIQQDNHCRARNHQQGQRCQLKNDFEIDAAQETHISPRSRPGLCRFGNRFYREDADALSIVTKLHHHGDRQNTVLGWSSAAADQHGAATSQPDCTTREECEWINQGS